MSVSGFLALLLVAPLTVGATEIVIEAGALTPAMLTVESDAPVTFTNRSGRTVHVEFLGVADGHQVFQVPALIRATFHRTGLHPYVVHFETRPRTELRGVVDVRERTTPRDYLPVCTGITVDEVCLEP
jgi:plastocyanin